MTPSPAALQLVGRAVSTRGTLPSLGGILVDRRRGLADPARHRHGARPDQHARRREGRAARAPCCSRAACSPTSSAACRRARSSLELRGEQRDVEIAAGGARFHLRTLPAEDFPRLPELEGETVKLPAAPLARDDRARRPRGLARRGAPDPHRRPGAGRGQRADDGRHRLLPAERQAHRARGAGRPGARGERPGARAARAGADHRRRGRRGGRDLAAAQPGRLPGRPAWCSPRG